MTEFDASEPEFDWEDLLERCQKDPGAPFEDDAIWHLTALRRADPAQYMRVRDRIKKAGIRIGELEKLLCSNNPRVDEKLDGTNLGLISDEPWTEEVSGSDLLNLIVTTIQQYVVVDTEEAEAMALWTVFTFAHDLFYISPRLAFVSPQKRCGKTTALSVVQHLTNRSLPTSNITSPAVFRVIEIASPTLLIDEADTFLKRNDELRGVLNSGHNRHQAYVIRNVGEDHTPARFSTWSPVAIAMIGRLPDTLEDRSIIISLKRKKAGEKVEGFRGDQVSLFNDLRRRIVRWVEDHAEDLQSWNGDVPNALNNRAADNWCPLFAIADCSGMSWPNVARKAALHLSGKQDDESIDVMLLSDIRDIFETSRAQKLPTQTILNKLNAMEERPWPEYGRGAPMTPTQLANRLKAFKIRPSTIRDGKETFKGYKRTSFEDAFSRYLPGKADTQSQGS